MAQHDFINKKRPNKSKKKAAKKKPIGWILVALTLLFAFIYGLFYIFTNSEEKKQSEAKKVVTVKKEALKKPVDSDFIQAIKEPDLVKVEVTEMEQKGPYVMQCGSYKSREQAETLKAKIAFTGIISFIKHQGSWFKVRLGPYETKRKAESDKNVLKRQRIIGCSIWFWNK
ncbi:SPOR domain-containing protein [Pseudoalteromonas sp. C2R02]|uniref:SPOR domain-containing protein n=1 Tax=Pseudoalteromonas sp. C2R02 TaxID=2841565 RepID=UPI001C0A3F20|nr:SPOR domain-containing protein [Pseudoalteromonas sp. C2R02]MBU2972601.1 SPOR domain-containing protein [Pseudoalteromonas sp. C2R02]